MRIALFLNRPVLSKHCPVLKLTATHDAVIMNLHDKITSSEIIVSQNRPKTSTSLSTFIGCSGVADLYLCKKRQLYIDIYVEIATSLPRRTKHPRLIHCYCLGYIVGCFYKTFVYCRISRYLADFNRFNESYSFLFDSYFLSPIGGDTVSQL